MSIRAVSKEYLTVSLCLLACGFAQISLAAVQVYGPCGEVVYLGGFFYRSDFSEDWTKRVYVEDRVAGQRRIFFEPSGGVSEIRLSGDGKLAVLGGVRSSVLSAYKYYVWVLNAKARVDAAFSPEKPGIRIKTLEW